MQTRGGVRGVIIAAAGLVIAGWPGASFRLPVRAQTADAAVHVWITAGDQSRLLTPARDAAFAAPGSPLPLTVAVDDSNVYQRVTGFGASLTESSAWLLYARLPAAVRSRWMTTLFSPTAGIGLSFLRQPIGASDFSLSHYSYDDVPYGETDETLSRFSASRDDAYVFPAVRDARQLNPQLSIMASPWSAPGWMKTSGTLVGGELRPEAYGAYAAYLVKAAQAYAARGIPLDSITVQNEPRYVPQDYPGMYLDASSEATLIGQHVGPAFEHAGLSTRIFAWDQNWNEPEYPIAVMQDPAAARYASGAAYHCYAGEPDEMSRFHEAFPSRAVYVTECSTGAWYVTPFDAALYENLRVLIRSMRNWAEAVAKWNVALDTQFGPHTGGCQTCAPLLTIDPSSASVTPTADFYALGHFSRFVRPGARRIGSTTFQSQGVESVAFVNDDGSHALVVWNGWGARTIRVSWNGAAFDYGLPGDAVATFVWDGNGSSPSNPPSSPPPPPQPPDPGATTAPFVVPGTIEAEDFADGSGIGYVDDSPGNNGGEYRQTDVDIERTADGGGGYNVGWISAGEWLAYPIAASATGMYRFDARVAANGPGGRFHLEVDGTAVGNPMTIPDTGGWQQWTTVGTDLPLTEGEHSLRVVFDAWGPTRIVGNVNVMHVVPAQTSSTAYAGVRASIPGRIQAELFDEGPDGIAYHDKEAANFGGQLRETGVDIEPTTDAAGGYNVGWMAPGEWLSWSIDAAAAGVYRASIRAASLGRGGTFHLEIDGVAVTGALAIPDTGWWQNWITIAEGGIPVTAGSHVLRLVVDTASPDGIVGNVNWLALDLAN
jgi:glucosylceramidase